jgi:predicted DNA-binding transcriptional regulator YafY
MQIARLFELLYLLLQKKSCTAGELSERLEVSVRTIYRDIETLSAAGIPVYAARGKGGGIRVMPGFALDKSLLNAKEQKEILAALQGFEAAIGDKSAVRGKLGAFFRQETPPWITIRFAGWGGKTDTFDRLRDAILKKRVARLCYHSVGRPSSLREVEPLQLLFIGHVWYLGAFCRLRDDYRIFRLSRIGVVEALEEAFERELPHEVAREWAWPREPREMMTVRLKIKASSAFRILDDFDPERVTELGDGSYLAEMTVPHGDDWAVGFILGFGSQARVLEPGWLAEAVRQEAKKITEDIVDF